MQYKHCGRIINAKTRKKVKAFRLVGYICRHEIIAEGLVMNFIL